MTEQSTGPSAERSPRLPPRWFVRSAWVVHRGYYRLTGGRRGLWRPTPDKWGTLLLRTTGRRTGREHAVIVAYVEDGPACVTLAMNGWAAPEPAWWLNLQAHPDAVVVTRDGPREVRAREAHGDERDRHWAAFREHGTDVDGFSVRRPHTAVVVLEPR
ncbi:nitroreductase/quinone reductase family protein [Luteimicrobium sp. NPDC057192]|uniref:nitroreductase/quinone reductase family protein n=1 Tax=Luteimicrobium sp. NPDC057192 TaxID=3346042 RepID=UPI0036440BC3